MNENLNIEDINTISKITNADTNATTFFETFKREALQNYHRLAGQIYSQAELDKLDYEQRPKFVANLLLPIILQLIGNFKNNASTVEAFPRTPGDQKFANIVTDLLDYALNQENNAYDEVARAYLDALVGRIGWLVTEWDYSQTPEGKSVIKRIDPFQLKWDVNFKRQDLSDCNYIIHSGWYTPEEILNLYARDNEELYSYLTEKIEILIGRNTTRKNQFLSWYERVWGTVQRYIGNVGFDNDNLTSRNNNYYDSQNGLFYIIEFHERRLETRYTLYDPLLNKEFDITKEINYENGKYDIEKLNQIKSQYNSPIITKKQINQIYQTTVAPALNAKLYDAPYPIQNNLFKYIPLWTFDFGMTNLENKSYVDHLIDPLSSYNLRRNQMLTYLMKTVHGEIWAEDNTLGEHEDRFMENRIGGLKYVKPGALTGGRIQRQPLPHFPAALDAYSQEDEELLKKISGVRDNAMGTSENSKESGVLYRQRVTQSDLLQVYVQDNAIKTLIIIAKNIISLYKTYMPKQKLLRVTRDELNPYWLMINNDIIQILSKDDNNILEQLPNNLFNIEYDIKLSKSPFSREAKEREFQELMLINDALAKLNPAFVDPITLVKAASTSYKDDLLNHIKLIIGQQQMQAEQINAQQEIENRQRLIKEDLSINQENNKLNQSQMQNQMQNQIQSIMANNSI